MFIVVWHCIQERGALGRLGQSFLKQGVAVYVIMTALNTLSIGTYFGPSISPELKGIGLGPWFAYTLPSALAIGFLSPTIFALLIIKASPTETNLRIEYSHMVNEALEMIPVECDHEDISKDLSQSIQPMRKLSLDADGPASCSVRQHEPRVGEAHLCDANCA
ncbi:hypothetical protein EI94DRAFT_1753102 [Lactarius quietus]|nr:hypothetical protein EI94DRAFT_1753102 [Lactarius quietus]